MDIVKRGSMIVVNEWRGNAGLPQSVMGLSGSLKGALSTFSMCLIFRSDSGSPVPYLAHVASICSRVKVMAFLPQGAGHILHEEGFKEYWVLTLLVQTICKEKIHV
jgi:hypothetical protein